MFSVRCLTWLWLPLCIHSNGEFPSQEFPCKVCQPRPAAAETALHELIKNNDTTAEWKQSTLLFPSLELLVLHQILLPLHIVTLLHFNTELRQKHKLYGVGGIKKSKQRNISDIWPLILWLIIYCNHSWVVLTIYIYLITFTWVSFWKKCNFRRIFTTLYFSLLLE